MFCLIGWFRMDWWQSSGYRSLCLHSEDSGEDEEEEGDDVSLASEGSTESDPTAIHYVLGDVTHPQTGPEDAIIVHCVGMNCPLQTATKTSFRQSVSCLMGLCFVCVYVSVLKRVVCCIVVFGCLNGVGFLIGLFVV